MNLAMLVTGAADIVNEVVQTSLEYGLDFEENNPYNNPVINFCSGLIILGGTFLFSYLSQMKTHCFSNGM